MNTFSAGVFLLLLSIAATAQPGRKACIPGRRDTLFGIIGIRQSDCSVKDSLGMTVKIDAKGHVGVTNRSGASANTKIDDVVTHIDEDENKITQEIQSPQGDELANMLRYNERELTRWKDFFQEMKRNELLANLNASNYVTGRCAVIKPVYDRLTAYYKANKTTILPVPPTPPAWDYECITCDTDRNNQYHADVKKWADDFISPEDKKMTKEALEISYAVYALKNTDDWQYATAGRDNPCSFMESADKDMMDFVHWMEERYRDKCDRTARAYGRDPQYTLPLTQALLPMVQQYAAMHGDYSFLEWPEYNFASRESDIAFKMFEELRHRNYKMIANIPVLISMLQQSAAMTGGDMHTINDMVNEMLADTRFRIKVAVDIKIGDHGVYEILKMHGETFLRTDLDSINCIAWKIDNPAKAMKMYVDNVEMLVPQGTPPKYIGVKEFNLPFTLKLNFCDQSGLAALDLKTFAPPTNDQVIETLAGRVPMITPILMEAFKTTEIKDSAAVIEQPEPPNEAALRAKMMKKVQEMQAMRATGNKNYTKGDYMSNINKMMEDIKKDVKLPSTENLLHFFFKLPFESSGPFVIKTRLDAKQLNPDLADKIVYGYLDIEITPDPAPLF